MIKPLIKHRMFIGYVILLHAAILGVLFQLWNINGTITQEQAKNIAIVYALKECDTIKDKDVQCGKVYIKETSSFCMDLLCTDTPGWILDYRAPKGTSDYVSGTIYLDRYGEYLPPQKMIDIFGTDSVVPDTTY